MTIQTNIANSLIAEILPVVLARPVLSAPRHGVIDPPVFAYLCPWCNLVHLITEELTLFPFATACHLRPVVVKLGSAAFVGEQLLRPDKQDRLTRVLDHLYREEMKAGHKARWMEVPRIKVPEDMPPPEAMMFCASTGPDHLLTSAVSTASHTGIHAHQSIAAKPALELVA